MILFDTHVWIWTINGDEKIRKSNYLTEINRAVKKHSIQIPAICTWEIATLVSKKRITLVDNTLDWIRKALSAPGISLCPLTPEIACESAQLPGDFHGDPADRMIVASARILNALLLTFDREIISYSKAGYVKVLEPRSI